MDIYGNLIIELHKNPLNKREIPHAHITHSGANVTCGDRVRIYASVSADGKTIKDASFEGEGCAISLAAASMVTENAKGASLEEIAHWDCAQIFDWLETELGPARIKCGLLALETLQEGIKRKMPK